MKIIGFEKISYVSRKTNRQVSGTKVYYTERNKNVIGERSDSFYISDENEHALNGINIDDEVVVYYDSYRNVAAIQKV